MPIKPTLAAARSTIGGGAWPAPCRLRAGSGGGTREEGARGGGGWGILVVTGVLEIGDRPALRGKAPRRVGGMASPFDGAYSRTPSLANLESLGQLACSRFG